MYCVQLLKKNYIKICLFQIFITIVYFVGFQQNLYAQNDTLQNSKKSSIASVDTITKSEKDSVKEQNKNLGKLPLKKSQLPELFLVIVLLSIFAVLRYYYPKFLPEVYANFINFHADSRILKNDRIGQVLPGLFYDIMHILLSCMLFWEIGKIYGSHANGGIHPVRGLTYFVIGGELIFYLLIKTYLIRFVSWIFNYSTSGNVILAYQLVLRNIITVIILCTVCFLLLINPIGISKFGLVVSTLLIIISYIYTILKLFIYFKKTSNTQIYNIFAYLCSVEILPLVLISILIYRQIVK